MGFVTRSDEGGAVAAVEAAAAHYARMLFLQRLRTHGDRAALARLFAATWGAPLGEPARMSVAVTPTLLRIGRAALPRAGAWEDPGAPGLKRTSSKGAIKSSNIIPKAHALGVAASPEAQQGCAAARWAVRFAGCNGSTQWICLEAYEVCKCNKNC